jgi:hypothetical protein
VIFHALIGTSVRVYGAVRNDPWDIINFTIDSTSSTIFTGSSDKEYGWNSLLYQVDGLAPAVHQLVVTNLNSTPLYLDYFTYDSVGPPLDAHVVDPPSASNLPNQPGLGWTGDQNQAKKIPAGAIVGGVLGGTALLILIGALICYHRRRRSLTHLDPDHLDYMRGIKGFVVRPFTSPPDPSTSRRRRRPTKGELAERAGRAPENALMHHANRPMDEEEGSTISGSGYPPTLDLSERDNPTGSQREQPQLRPMKNPATRTGGPRNTERDAGDLPHQSISSPIPNPSSSQLVSPPPAYHDIR